jgi:hypothetical protein
VCSSHHSACTRPALNITLKRPPLLRSAMLTPTHARYCFAMAYQAAFLHSGLKVPWETRMPVLGQIRGVQVEWAVGMMLSDAVSARVFPSDAVGAQSLVDARHASSASYRSSPCVRLGSAMQTYNFLQSFLYQVDGATSRRQTYGTVRV